MKASGQQLWARYCPDGLPPVVDEAERAWGERQRQDLHRSMDGMVFNPLLQSVDICVRHGKLSELDPSLPS